MNKIWTVAKNEYLISVTSKAFLFGIVMMPIMMGGVFLVQLFTKDKGDISPRRIAIVDKTGQLLQPIKQAAELRNEHAIFENKGGDDQKQIEARFLIESPPVADEDQRLDVLLSQKIRDGDLFAFAVIEKEAFEAGSGSILRYYSETPSYMSLSMWLSQVVNDQVKRVRSQQMGLTPENVAQLSAGIGTRHYGLVATNEAGDVIDAKEENRILTFAIPFGGLMLMFMMLMSVAPTMLNNVLEEKMQKISEFLVSSISPFQLMLGKLLGAVGVGLTLSTIYLSAAIALTYHYEVADQIPISLYFWFVFFLFFALIIFGSLFSAIGAACSEIRDAQSLMTPLMLMVVLPMMCFPAVLDSPSSPFSKAISLFPPATPMLMFLRIAIPPGPDWWEIALGATLTVLFAMVCVWGAGKIFRVGVLSQGQAPTFGKLIGWVFSRQ